MPDSAIRRLLEFDDQVQRDRNQSPAFLHRRDRRFALDCQRKGITPGPEQWLVHIRHLANRAPGTDALQTWRRLTAGFALAGFIAGVFAMLGLLFYDGGQKINLTVILAFVLLQAVLAIFTTVQAVAGWQPWRWLMRKVSTASSPSQALNTLQPLLMARAAHTGGLMFGLAGLLTLLVMVVIQDLAFGWSTTLNTGADSYHRLLSAIAAPWQNLWPAATPSADLVEATRFFRGQPVSNTNPALWGSWWPFVAMVWITYVILPRVALLALAIIHPGLRARRALAGHHGWVALQYRMETPTVDTGNRHNDADDQPDVSTSAKLQPLPGAQALIQWAGAGGSELPHSLPAGDGAPLSAGGGASLAHDSQSISLAGEALASARSPAAIIVTRGWEPPTGELSDFLKQARQAWPEDTVIALVPLAAEADQPPPPHQLGQWLRFAERAADERMVVSTLAITPPDTRIHRALQDEHKP